MAANFTVSDAAVQSYVTDGGINVTRYQLNASGVMQAVIQSGGKVYPNLAPVTTTIPVTSGQTAIAGVAESTAAATSQRSVGPSNLLVAAHDEAEAVTDESMRAQIQGAASADALMPQFVAAKSPAIYAGFDGDHLTPICTGATSIEYAGNAISAIDSAMALYDESDYYGDAMIVTRKGRRVLGLSQNADNMLQFPAGVSGVPFDGPIVFADIKSADAGETNLLAVIGPFRNCAVGWASDTIVNVFDQLEETNTGNRERIIWMRANRYLGFAKPAVGVIPATGFVKIVDNV